jgi:branched-chain amino acid aminotransferase
VVLTCRRAAEAGLSVRSKRITRDEVVCADEVFLTGTAAEITPVVEVDARRIGSGQPGPLTRTLQAAYFASVRGEAETHREWLTMAG